VKLNLDNTTREWQEKARRFAVEELIPCELEAEMNEGRLPPEISKRHKKMAIELGFSSMDVPREHGGLELRIVDQVAVWEQLGRVTNALCWCFSEPHEWMFEACDEDQLQRFVLPLMTGERKECYAITEADSGSEVVINTTAELTDEGYRINGEKWFVTSANLADYFFLQAKLVNGPYAGSDAMFFIDKDTQGIEEIRVPAFSHTFDHHHPELSFNNVLTPVENRIGAEGSGMSRDCGAAARLIEEATAWAKEREVAGGKLIDKQLVQAMLADSVTELWAARLITFEAAEAHDRGEDVKSLHARCSIAKLYASEAAYRIADRAVQIFGGRGYMRENCAERFSREIRVDRIWEGASEIQRLIIARALAKRGLEDM